jgi:hypothetical protein
MLTYSSCSTGAISTTAKVVSRTFPGRSDPTRRSARPDRRWNNRGKIGIAPSPRRRPALRSCPRGGNTSGKHAVLDVTKCAMSVPETPDINRKPCCGLDRDRPSLRHSPGDPDSTDCVVFARWASHTGPSSVGCAVGLLQVLRQLRTATADPRRSPGNLVLRRARRCGANQSVDRERPWTGLLDGARQGFCLS